MDSAPRVLHDVKKDPELVRRPETISHYANWSASRETYKLMATAGYYRQDRYVSASLSIKLTLYAKADETREVVVCQLAIENPRQALSFLRTHVSGGLWETFDAVSIDYEEIHAQAVTWFAEKCDHEFDR